MTRINHYFKLFFARVIKRTRDFNRLSDRAKKPQQSSEPLCFLTEVDEEIPLFLVFNLGRRVTDYLAVLPEVHAHTTSEVDLQTEELKTLFLSDL